MAFGFSGFGFGVTDSRLVFYGFPNIGFGCVGRCFMLVAAAGRHGATAACGVRRGGCVWGGGGVIGVCWPAWLAVGSLGNVEAGPCLSQGSL